MSKEIKIRKGVNIKLKGVAEKLYTNPTNVSETVKKSSDYSID